MIDTLLHSGSFNDYNGDLITVEISKLTDLNADPSTVTHSSSGGTVLLYVWSNDGAAVIDESNLADWITVRYIRGTPLEGSDNWKYLYSILFSQNSTGSARSTSLRLYIEDDEGHDTGLEMLIPVKQTA